MHSRIDRAALTLVELLIVIGIVAILAGLLLPAIQYARESARLTGCNSNLRQVGVALNSYHDAHHALPPALIWFPYGEPFGGGVVAIGVIDRVGRSGTVDNDTIYGNWVAMLLPQLEQQGVYDQLDRTVPISHSRNAGFRVAELAIMKCPSDVNNSAHFMRGFGAGLAGNEYARGNYAINVGPDNNCVMGTRPHGVPCESGFIAAGGDLLTESQQAWGSGVAGVNRSFRFADLKDGLSSTVVVDEIRCGIDPLDPRGAWALGQVGSSLTAQHGKFADAGSPNPLAVSSDKFIGCTALAQKLGMSQLSVERMPCYVVGISDELNIQGAARSTHTGGVNVLFADGSVRLIVDQVDGEVWHAIHTRAGTETLTTSF